jgi:hypothetical protein
MKYILLFFCFISFAQAATIYKQIDEKGNITYSDTPLKNSKVIIVPDQSSTRSSPKSKTVSTPTTSTPTQPNEQHLSYKTFDIISPTDQQTFQNQRQIPVQINIEPDLQPGDKIQLYLDGNPYASPEARTTLELNELDRGSHTITAVIFDKNHSILKSSKTITVFIQYARLGGTGV